MSEIYAGDLSRWRRHREHELSFRQLAARTQVDLRMSPTTLYRAVALYELCSRLSVELWRDFGAGHLRAVIGLPEPDQVRLLSLAKVEGWTARELYQQAGRRRGGPAVRRRRATSASQLVELLRQLLALLRKSDDVLPDEDRALRALVADVRHQIEQLPLDASRPANDETGGYEAAAPPRTVSAVPA